MINISPGQYLILAWGLVISIIILSILPGSSMPKYDWMELFAADKWGHFAFYGTAAWSFSKYNQLKQPSRSKWFIGMPLFLLGVSLECVQYLMKQGRSFDLFDILANGIGVFCGLRYFDMIFRFVFRKSL